MPEGNFGKAEQRSRFYGPDPKKVGWSVLVDSSEYLIALARKRAAFFGGVGKWTARGLVVVGSIGLLVGLLRREAVEEVPVDLAFEKRTREGKRLAAEVNGAVGGYYAAETIEERLAFVCEPERVRPLMEDHYIFHALEVRQIKNVEIHATVTRFTTRHAHYFASVTDVEEKVSVIVLREEETGLKIDWEALEAYNPIGITNLIRFQPPGETSLRVMARPSDYYNFEFIDPAVWQAFVLWNPNDPDILLHGYCRKDAEVCWDLLALTSGGHSVAARLTVGRSPEHNGGAMVEIRAIEAPHWLGGDA